MVYDNINKFTDPCTGCTKVEVCKYCQELREKVAKISETVLEIVGYSDIPITITYGCTRRSWKEFKNQ